MAVQRVGAFIEVEDQDGCRHLVRISAIQWLSDADQCRDETLLTAAGRTIHILRPLDELRNTIDVCCATVRSQHNASTKLEDA